MGFDWDALPEQVAHLLASGSEGGAHLLQAAHAAFSAKRPHCAALGVDAVCAAWEADPFNPALTAQAAQLAEQAGGRPELARAARQAADMVATSPPSPALDRLVARGDMERVRDHVHRKAGESGPNPAVISRILPLAVELGRSDWLIPLAEGVDESAGPARLALLADLHFMNERTEEARAHYETALAAAPCATWHTRLAGCLVRMGRTDAARLHYRAALELRPWSVNAALTLHDLARGVASERTPPPGRTEVFVYTYNKADDLGRCLETLLASELGSGRITVLDNGSTDETPRVLDALAGRFGAAAFSRIDLPVNVGAPAARNWLTRPEALQGVDYVAFLDDDALVPPDWLELLGAAVARHPEAGVWGCKVKDAHAGSHIQNADLSLRPPEERAEGAATLRMTDLHQQTFDAGQFDYLRPCVSVTGCCHLIDARTLRRGPDFHIGFSPTQFDDLDRDLRRFAEGGSAVYTGHLAVGHLRCSGKAGAAGGVASGNALGNQIKLDSRHPTAEVRTMLARQTRMLLDDLRTKTAWLAGNIEE